MLGREAELKAPEIRSRFAWLEGFVERSLGVRIQVVHHQRDPLAFEILRVEQAGHLQRPIDFCPLGTSCCLTV